MGFPKRILVVDDDPAVLFVLQEGLADLGPGYAVIAARDGYEALSRIAEAPFDMIITDLKMPGMDGIELTKRIAILNPQAVVIWITACGDLGKMATARQLAVYRYLEKPLDLTVLRQLAREAMPPAASSTAGDSR